jgi:hypothetical protein
MAKDSTFWFPHDYEPTSDFKMQALIGEYGAVGYGIFWRFTEMLHSENEHRLPMKPYLFLAIAKQMQANAEQVEAVLNFAINTCELFETDGKFFWSNRVNRNLEDRAIISQKRSIAGKEGAKAKQLLKANKQTQAQDRTGQDNTILKEWVFWGDQIVNGNDQYWEQMKGRRVLQEEMVQFISVATRNKWTMTTQQEFRTTLHGFKLNGTANKKTNYKVQ